MKSPLKRLAVGAQPTAVSSWSSKLDWDRIAKARRKAGIATAVAAVVAAGTASSLFVDYLADRAVERGASLARIAATQTEVQVASNEQQGEPMETMLPEATSASASLAAAPARSPAVTPAQAGVATAGELLDRSADPATDGEQIFAYDSSEVRGGPSPAELAAEKLAGDDRMLTSAIPLPETAPPPAPNPSTDKLAAINVSAQATGGQAGRTTQAVTMRSGPAKRAGQIAVVPAKSTVTVIGCKSWCEIVYNGKKGFVYKRFVRKS